MGPDGCRLFTLLLHRKVQISKRADHSPVRAIAVPAALAMALATAGITLMRALAVAAALTRTTAMLTATSAAASTTALARFYFQALRSRQDMHALADQALDVRQKGLVSRRAE